MEYVVTGGLIECMVAARDFSAAHEKKAGGAPGQLSRRKAQLGLPGPNGPGNARNPYKPLQNKGSRPRKGSIWPPQARLNLTKNPAMGAGFFTGREIKIRRSSWPARPRKKSRRSSWPARPTKNPVAAPDFSPARERNIRPGCCQDTPTAGSLRRVFISAKYPAARFFEQTRKPCSGARYNWSVSWVGFCNRQLFCVRPF